MTKYKIIGSYSTTNKSVEKSTDGNANVTAGIQLMYLAVC